MPNRQLDTTTTAEAEKMLAFEPNIYNHFIEITDRRDCWRTHEPKLEAALSLLLADEPFGLRHKPPPPLWMEDGNDVCREWRAQNPDHPMTDDRRASARRQAANEILTWAWCVPDAFTPERTEMLSRCLPDCDASVRFDLIRAAGFLGARVAADTLREFIRLECESPNCKAMAEILMVRQHSTI